MAYEVPHNKETLEEFKSLVAQLPKKDQAFATSLIEQGMTKKSGLSDKQWYWVGRLMEAALLGDGEIEPREKKLEEVPNALFAKFNAAKEKIKYPKMVFEFDGMKIQLAMAGPSSKNPGAINCTDGKPFGSNKYYGRLLPDGTYVVGKDFDQKVERFLAKLTADVEGTIKNYGHKTGVCCMCNSELTDPKSIKAGIGPVCAAHWGLKAIWDSAEE